MSNINVSTKVIFLSLVTINSSNGSIVNTSQCKNDDIYTSSYSFFNNQLNSSLIKSSKPTQLDMNIISLENIKKYESNWNGLNGKSFDSNFLNLLSIKLNQLNKQPSIYPTGRGSIQFEYYLKDNILEIEVYSDFNCEYFSEKNGKISEGNTEFENINNLVNEFYC
jgi:hypothetical protein